MQPGLFHFFVWSLFVMVYADALHWYPCNIRKFYIHDHEFDFMTSSSFCISCKAQLAPLYDNDVINGAFFKGCASQFLPSGLFWIQRLTADGTPLMAALNFSSSANSMEILVINSSLPLRPMCAKYSQIATPTFPTSPNSQPTINYSLTTSSYSVTPDNYTITTTNYSVTPDNYTITTANYSATTANYSVTLDNYSVMPDNYTITTANYSVTAANHSVNTDVKWTPMAGYIEIVADFTKRTHNMAAEYCFQLNATLVTFIHPVQYMNLGKVLNFSGVFWVQEKDSADQTDVCTSLNTIGKPTLWMSQCKERFGSICARPAALNATDIFRDILFASMIRNMTINTRKTSKSLRKLVSVPDKRRSARVIGNCLGVAILIILACITVLSDVHKMSTPLSRVRNGKRISSV